MDQKENRGPDMERLERQMAFIREADKAKSIFRQNYLAD